VLGVRKAHCITGAEVRPAATGVIKGEYGKLRTSADQLTFTTELEAASHLPLVRAAALISEIDYEGRLTVQLAADRRSAGVEFIGKVDLFAPFELYTRADDGPVIQLSSLLPEPGRTPMWLGGSANRPVHGKVTLGPP
jgi:hypothetical protein